MAFEIVSTESREKMKFKTYINDFEIKVLEVLKDVGDIYRMFQKLVRTVKEMRKLNDNDMLRIVIQNERLPNAISTKLSKIKDFEIGSLERAVNILEYRSILIEECKITIQSVAISVGRGRLLLTKDTISKKKCIITIKNDDSMCLARAIVTAYANLKSEMWSNTQRKNGFNGSRKLQRVEAMNLHKESNVEINDYGNDLSDVERFANHLGIEINITDAEQFNSIIYMANKSSDDKVYLLKNRNHFDVIKSLTAFYSTPYYCHDCKKTYTKKDKHKCLSKCLSCFTYSKNVKCK